jgi:hypothetical protein
MIPRLGIMVTGFTTSRTTNNLGAATYSHTEATKKMGDDDEGHGEFTSYRIAGEPPPCQ